MASFPHDGRFLVARCGLVFFVDWAPSSGTCHPCIVAWLGLLRPVLDIWPVELSKTAGNVLVWTAGLERFLLVLTVKVFRIGC